MGCYIPTQVSNATVVHGILFFMEKHGYGKTTANHCVLAKNFSDGHFITLLLYVDDMLIVGHDI
jgi:hypothetical protein